MPEPPQQPQPKPFGPEKPPPAPEGRKAWADLNARTQDHLTNSIYHDIIKFATDRMGGDQAAATALVPHICASIGRRAANAANQHTMAQEFVRLEKGVPQV